MISGTSMNQILAIGPLALIFPLSGLFFPPEAPAFTWLERGQIAQATRKRPVQYQFSEDMLRELVAEMNKNLPLELVKSIRWDSLALGAGRTLIYRYTFLDPAVTRIDAEQRKTLKNNLVQSVCEDEKVRLLLDDSVTLHFKYYTSRGNNLTEVRVQRQDCP